MPCSPRRGPWKSLVFYVLELPSSYSDPSPHMIPRNNTQLLSGYGNESSSPLSRDVPIAYPSRPMAHTPILFDLYPKGMELLSPFRGEGWMSRHERKHQASPMVMLRIHSSYKELCPTYSIYSAILFIHDEFVSGSGIEKCCSSLSYFTRIF